MSFWPIAAIICIECDRIASVREYGLDRDDPQQDFFDLLTRDGWDTLDKAKNVEADDDFLVCGYCPNCH